MKKALTVILWMSMMALTPFRGSAAFIDAPSTNWTAITYAGTLPDAPDDQQTGQAGSDLVGDAFHAALYTQFDDGGTIDPTDGTIAFRVRLGSVKDYKKLEYNYNLFIGIDVDLDEGIDIFVGVDTQPNGTGNITIWSPGTGLNNSPANTTLNTTPLFTFAEIAESNYSIDLVDSTIDPLATTNDVDGGNIDAFLSFSVDFGDLVSALNTNGFTITENSTFNYVTGTARANSDTIDLDINGVNGGVGSSETFATLGGYTDSYTPTGDAIPEPVALSLIGVGGLFCFGIQRLKRRTSGAKELPHQ